MQVSALNRNDHDELIILWESSVRATHDFLREEDIAYLRPLVAKDALPKVELYGVKNQHGKILGFLGTSHTEIEMLFVDPKHFGEGIGTALLEQATKNMGLTKVSVNEQNPNALSFYQNRGFVVTSRSELDGQGRPFPILDLTLVR